jgi:putative endonuclease
MASRSLTLYIGMTNDLFRRVWEHKMKINKCFTKRYRINRLVYYEVYDTPLEAIGREKQLKGWRRSRKVALIDSCNPTWSDLSEEWDSD